MWQGRKTGPSPACRRLTNRNTSARFRRPARRPAYSVLGHDRWSGTGVAPLPDWRAMLAEAMPVLLR